MENILNLIEEKGQVINYKEDYIKYLEIASFSNLAFSYGATERGWLVNKDNKSFLIEDIQDNYIAFFSLLELPSNSILDTIKTSIKQFTNEKILIFDFFPIISITKTAINMQSTYWSILCLDLLLENKLYHQDLLDCLYNEKKEKWISQSLKHKILKYISRVRDNEWNNSSLK